ncbi:MAG: DUF3368 domain-containing protein [Deltaproteobacteria bacterium]|nr:DUF3368 domain-containing protein [Deltaproteobacteria bacterium]
MPELVVVNSSPLLVLARAQRLELLQGAGQTICVTRTVLDEVCVHSDEAARVITACTFLNEVEDEPIPELLRTWDLGAGETSVLSWASAHPDCLAVLDDFAARKCAAVLGLRLIGTLGLALAAKKEGLVPTAAPLLAELRRAGLYLSDHVVEQALRLVGE